MTLEGVRVTGVECLSNCDHGCTLALRGPGRWTYVYGRLDETADLAPIGDGIARYRATVDGLVPWRERPEHFRKNCIARIPPLETA
jgi:predicted metal-binding protein